MYGVYHMRVRSICRSQQRILPSVRGASKLFGLRGCGINFNRPHLHHMAQHTERTMMGVMRKGEGEKRVAPATERNKDAILAELRKLLPEEGAVLELASGYGQHVAHFAAALPGLTWQPSDYEEEHFESVLAYSEGLSSVKPPLILDASAATWPVEGEGASYDAVLASNVCHISPWDVSAGIMKGAGRLLKPGGLLFLYGPFKVDGQCTTPSNADFDRALRERNPAWGIRDIADLEAAGAGCGIKLEARLDMPANNFSLVFRKE